MTFIIRSGGSSFTLPLDPQNWQYVPNPRINIQKTLGGQVVQLLGYTVSGTFSGLLHGRTVSRQDAWNDMSMLKSFMVNVMENQKNGTPAHVSWPDQGLDFDCALGDLQISESVDQTGFNYSIGFQVVNRSAMRSGSNMSSIFDTILSQIGFKIPGTTGAYHGGHGDFSKITQITGMGGTGPGATSGSSESSSDSSGAQLSTDSSIAAIQQYAHDQVLNKYHWSEADFQALVQLWNHESEWKYNAGNPTSSAYGIPQAMMSAHDDLPADYKTNPKAQVDWGLRYIAGRYGTPSAAWAFWQRRVPINGKDVGHWY